MKATKFTLYYGHAYRETILADEKNSEKIFHALGHGKRTKLNGRSTTDYKLINGEFVMTADASDVEVNVGDTYHWILHTVGWTILDRTDLPVLAPVNRDPKSGILNEGQDLREQMKPGRGLRAQITRIAMSQGRDDLTEKQINDIILKCEYYRVGDIEDQIVAAFIDEVYLA